MMIEYIREIDAEKQNVKQENNIAQYKKQPGVWILLGKKQSNDSLVCLQVGQCKDIAGEIEINISHLNAKVKNSDIQRSKHYYNQFGKEIFKYDEYPGRREMLYSDIAQHYENLTFYVVAYGDKLKEEKLRINIEKYIAYKTSCIYWANGRPYGKEKSKEEIELIKEKCMEECLDLFIEIKSNYPEKADFINKFLNKLIEGKISDLNC